MSKQKKGLTEEEARSLYGDDAVQYATFDIKDKDGTHLADVSLPQSEIEGLLPAMVERKAIAFYIRMQMAQEALDSGRIKELAEETKPKMIEAFATQIAAHAAGRIYMIYAKRAGEEAIGDEDTFRQFIDRQKVIVLDWLKQFPEVYERLHIFLWQHAIAWALEQMEKDYGREALEAMSIDEYDALLDKYILDEDFFLNTVTNIASLHAQDYANLFVEALDPEGLPLEKLRRFLGFVARKDKDGLLLNVFNGPDYHALREALAQKAFHKEDGVPWPTASLDKGGARGHAQLRPVAVEHQPLMPPEEVEAWAKIMWRQREELSDLDADALDALSAIWLSQARSINDDAVADVDELLAMRGIQPKKSGQGRRGGYMPEQRAQMLQALSHIQNIWLDMAEVDAYEDTGKGKKRRTKQAIQSRPFVITDRMGQVRLDGYMDVQKFIFKPGKVFARFLMRQGRQTALLSAKALHFDPYRQKWEKRLARYLSWQWRNQAYNGQYMQPYRVATLLEAAGEAIDKNAPSRTRDRLEKALDTLQSEGVIGAWQYDRWNEDAAGKRGWAKRWEQATVLIEPPDEIRDHYQKNIEKPVEDHKQQAQGGTLNERVKARRKMLRLSQLQAAEQIGISQALLSQIERGRKPSSATQKKLEAWLSQAG